MTDFVDELKDELPDLLQLLLNMNQLMRVQLVKWLQGERGYTQNDAAVFVSTIQPHSAYRWRKEVTRMRLDWISAADDLSSLLFRETKSRLFLLRILLNHEELTERDPETVLTESKRKQWLSMIRQFDNLKFE